MLSHHLAIIAHLFDKINSKIKKNIFFLEKHIRSVKIKTEDAFKTASSVIFRR